MLPTDLETKTRVRSFLASKGYGLGRLDIDVEEGTVILTGQVTSFYEKQLAISCAQHVPHVRHMNVDIDVVDTGEKAEEACVLV